MLNLSKAILRTVLKGGVCVESWGSVGATLHTPQTLYTSAFQKIWGSGEVFGDFRLFCVNPLEKYSYQPIPQLPQPVPHLAQPVPHLYQLYKKKSGAPIRSSALTIHECLLLILVFPVVAASANFTRISDWCTTWIKCSRYC